MRELRNVVERAVILCDVDHIQVGHLLPAASEGITPSRPLSEIRRERLREVEYQYVTGQLNRHDGHLTRAAAASGLTPSALSKLCKKLGIDLEEFRSP